MFAKRKVDRLMCVSVDRGSRSSLVGAPTLKLGIGARFRIPSLARPHERYAKTCPTARHQTPGPLCGPCATSRAGDSRKLSAQQAAIPSWTRTCKSAVKAPAAVLTWHDPRPPSVARGTSSLGKLCVPAVASIGHRPANTLILGS